MANYADAGLDIFARKKGAEAAEMREAAYNGRGAIFALGVAPIF
jgi:hypothetical protein